MTETLYTIVNVLVLPPWLLLIVAPRWKWTLPLASIAYPSLLGLMYVALLAFNVRSMTDGIASLDNLARLFENPSVLLMGWVHYLAFDLFVGSWQVRDAQRLEIPHVLVVPCLLLTLLLGPTGLVCYFAIRFARSSHRNKCSKRSAARGAFPARLSQGSQMVSAMLMRTVRESYRRNRLLTLVGGSLLVSVLPLLSIAAFDSRSVEGLNPWIKPMKFSASLGVYFLTLGWLLAYLPGPRWAVRTITWVTAGAILLETPILVFQAARGVTSHFNVATSLDATLYFAMGAAAVTQMVLLGWTLWLFCTQKVAQPAFYLYGIRAGMALVLLGMLPGFAMVGRGQHSVGVADGGAGLPLANWSTAGGDLRVAHFFGLHAIQVLPLVGLAFNRLQQRLGTRQSLAAFKLFVGAYALLLVSTFVQALAGEPLLALLHGQSLS